MTQMKQFDTISPQRTDTMIGRPRLVVELTDNELVYQLKVIAAKERRRYRDVVLIALADKYPELKDIVEKELTDKN
jgi:hypothetical protein